jgi:hypothetical protein
MINRAPTRIDLKLEDDLCDYEETIKQRQNIQSNFEFSSSGNKSKYEESETNYIPQTNNFHSNFELNTASPNVNRNNRSVSSQITKMNVISKFISEEDEEYEDNVELEMSHFDGVGGTPGSGMGDISMR